MTDRTHRSERTAPLFAATYNADAASRRNVMVGGAALAIAAGLPAAFASAETKHASRANERNRTMSTICSRS